MTSPPSAAASPFLSQPDSPPAHYARNWRGNNLSRSIEALTLAEAAHGDEDSVERTRSRSPGAPARPVRRSRAANSSEQTSSGTAASSPGQSRMSSRLRAGSQSAIIGSWSAGFPKSGYLGLGNHSLMQMINALGMDSQCVDEMAEPNHEEPGTPTDLDAGDISEGRVESPVSNNGPRSSMNLRQSKELSSSIHAIYSPRGRRQRRTRHSLDPVLDERSESESPPEEDRGGEFSESEEEAPISLDATQTLGKGILPLENGDPIRQKRKEMRRATLAEKLREIFELQNVDEILLEHRCWLFRSVLLQGYLFLTTGHLCFFAYLKAKEDAIVRSGNLSRRTGRARIYQKSWFVLKDEVLSWYTSSQDPYFPLGQIDMHYALDVVPSAKNCTQFTIIAAHRKHHFAADSQVSQQEWIKVLRKVMHRAQNEGESLKMVIPLESIVTIDFAENFEFARNTIAIGVRDADSADEAAPDTYYWSFPLNPEETIITLRATADKAKAAALVQHVDDSALATALPEIDRQSATTAPRPSPVQLSLLAASRTSSSALLEPKSAGHTESKESTTQAQSEVTKAIPRPIKPPQGSLTSHVKHPYPMDMTTSFISDAADASSQPTIPSDHTYPPDLSGTTPPGGALAGTTPTNRPESWRLAQWIRGNPKRLLALPASFQLPSIMPFAKQRVLETLTMPAVAPAFPHGTALLEHEEDVAIAHSQPGEDLRAFFSLGKAENVIARHHAYLFRGFPLYGIVYATDEHLCFRSTNVISKTKMILPIKDIIAVQGARAYRPGYNGMVVVVRGHEELFFEFAVKEKRDLVIRATEGRLIELRNASEIRAVIQTTDEQQASDLKALTSSVKSPVFGDMASDESPPVMFSSTTSSFVTFKPLQPLRIACLTIGSRGDVQPYIALCKGLMQDGHSCRIASHPEYQEWIAGHGIDFRPVGGDPAELMRICVENGTFTVAFLREGVSKFRGWLDELLDSAWDACQGSDLLIESPSTMAGCHIAEALQIPFYRAFTMPWTRTRAYPHAFAVPDTKMGGGYNYMTYTIFDQVFWRAISGQVNRWRKEQLGLWPTSLERLETHKSPFLYNFSPSVVPAPLDWMEFIHVTGYWFLDNADTAAKVWDPPSALLEFIAQARALGKKLVYIGFGSIVVSDPDGLTKMVTDAVAEADVWAVISKGWSDRAVAKAHAEGGLESQSAETGQYNALPSSIFNITSVPHDWLFPKMDAVCHHGGAGTTGASMRAGKPTIIRPFFGDQSFWAERVESLRVGVALRQMSAHSLAQALHTCTADDTIISNAERLGRHIRQEDGVATAIEAIYRDLEYAKSLIKRSDRLPLSKASEDMTYPVAPWSPHRQGAYEGAFSDESSSWDMLSERTSSGPGLSDHELEEEE